MRLRAARSGQTTNKDDLIIWSKETKPRKLKKSSKWNIWVPPTELEGPYGFCQNFSPSVARCDLDSPQQRSHEKFWGKLSNNQSSVLWQVFEFSMSRASCDFFSQRLENVFYVDSSASKNILLLKARQSKQQYLDHRTPKLGFQNFFYCGICLGSHLFIFFIMVVCKIGIFANFKARFEQLKLKIRLRCIKYFFF